MLIGVPREIKPDEARVALMEGSPFGAGFGDHVRLNIATSPARLTEIVERLAKAWT